MKVGDLVQCKPARVGYFIILKKCEDNLWLLVSTSGMDDGLMHEQFIEVISESR